MPLTYFCFLKNVKVSLHHLCPLPVPGIWRMIEERIKTWTLTITHLCSRQWLWLSERGGHGREQPAGVWRGWARVWHPAGGEGKGDGCVWTWQAVDGSLPLQILRGLQELPRKQQRSVSFLLLSQRNRTGLIYLASSYIKENVSLQYFWNFQIFLTVFYIYRWHIYTLIVDVFTWIILRQTFIHTLLMDLIYTEF